MKARPAPSARAAYLFFHRAGRISSAKSAGASSSAQKPNAHDLNSWLLPGAANIAKSAMCAPPAELDRLEREIASTDQEIGDLVYELYGLTAKERKIIEGN
jgi:hypothetical protein